MFAFDNAFKKETKSVINMHCCLYIAYMLLIYICKSLYIFLNTIYAISLSELASIMSHICTNAYDSYAMNHHYLLYRNLF